MNILQIISRLDSSAAAEDVIQSTKFFTLQGHKVVVVSAKGSLVKEIDAVGARHFTQSLRPNIFMILPAIFKLSKVISKENIDIVHARDGISSLVAFFASRFKEKTFVASVYGYPQKGFFKKASTWAKRVIFFNETQARLYVKNGLVSRSKVCVVPPFVNIGNVDRAGTVGYFVMGAALSLSSQETHQAFIRAISRLSRTIHRLKVLIIDNAFLYQKDYIEKFKLLVKRHSLDNIVTFAPQEKFEKLFSGLDLFIQVNTEAKTSARPLLEAAGRGIPVITTRTDWLKDYFGSDRKSFLVYQPNDPEDLVARTLELYKDKLLREKMANDAKDLIKERFNIKKVMESTLNVYENALSRKNILIIKIGATGDAILVIPSVRAIRQKFPDARIKLLVGINNREVFINSPFIDEIIVCDFKDRDRGLKGLLRIAGKLRSENFDMVVDFQNNKRSHLLSFLSCAPKRFGYDNGKLSFLLNRKIKDGKIAIDPVEHQSKVLGLLGIFDIVKNLELWPSREDEIWADNFLSSHWVSPALARKDGIKRSLRPIALNIGSSPRWITKLWPAEYFAQVCNRLAKDFGIRSVLIGKEAKSPEIEDFLKRAKCKPINALGRTNIPKLASLIKRCGVLLSSDSAPVHVAAAVGTPFIALFGPTDPARHLVPDKKNVVIKKELPCSPCYHTHCDRGYACMRDIKPDEVYKAILELLKVKDKSQIPIHKAQTNNKH